MDLNVTTERRGQTIIVRPAGRLDSSTAPAFESDLMKAVAEAPSRLAVDATNLSYVSSAGLRVLLVAAKALQPAGGTLVLFGLNDNVREIFEISGFDTLFAIHASEADALAPA